MDPVCIVSHKHIGKVASFRIEPLSAAAASARGAVVVKPERFTISLTQDAEGNTGILIPKPLTSCERFVFRTRLAAAGKGAKQRFRFRTILVNSTIDHVRTSQPLKMDFERRLRHVLLRSGYGGHHGNG